MKRKVIQIAGSTQLISLPREWAKLHDVRKGEELEVEAQGDKVVISARGAIAMPEKATVNITNMGVLARMILGALYKGGYDEIKVIFSDQEEFRHINDVLTDYCVGFEIIEQGKDYVVARKISDTIHGEFDAVLRRMMLFISTMAKEGLEAVQKEDISELNQIIIMDNSINKFNFFCRRVLNKIGNQGSYKKTSSLYYMVDTLEEIADSYKELYKTILAKKIKLNKNMIALFAQTNLLLEIFNTMFYKFELAKMQEFIDGCAKWDDLNNKCLKTCERQEVLLMIHMNTIYSKIASLDGPLLLFRYVPS